MARVLGGVTRRTLTVVVALRPERRMGSVAMALSPLPAEPTEYIVTESGENTGLPIRATWGPGVTL